MLFRKFLYFFSFLKKECRLRNQSTLKTVISGYYLIKDEANLQRAVATLGPISVAVNIQPSFNLYKSGVYYDKNCNPNNLYHASKKNRQHFRLNKDFYLVIFWSARSWLWSRKWWKILAPEEQLGKRLGWLWIYKNGSWQR